MRALLPLITLLCIGAPFALAQEFSAEALLPFNATCAEIDGVRVMCVDEGMGCNDTAGALLQVNQGKPVYVCREGLNCQLPPPGFPAASPFQCAPTARIGELCSCSALDFSCAALGCFDHGYQVSCINALCRGTNVYGAGEPASFNSKAVCDRSSSAPFPNGGCVEQVDVHLSLICDSTTSTCSSVEQGASCAGDLLYHCKYDSFCDGSTCQPRVVSPGASCNYTANNEQDCGPLLHCVPDNHCLAWFSGNAGQSCSVNEDCILGHYCDSASRSCVAASTTSACNSPSDSCGSNHLDEACVCDNGAGQCTSNANTQAHIDAWTALVTCVNAHKCFPVVPRAGVPTSLAELNFFPGGCYDTFCHKEWLALTHHEHPCESSAAIFGPLVLIIVAVLIAALL